MSNRASHTQDVLNFAPEYQGVWDTLDDQDKSHVVLWRAIVGRGILDLAISKPDPGDQSQAAQKRRRIIIEASDWVGSEDFPLCCQLALVDHRVLRPLLHQIVGMKDPYRKLRLMQLADQINTCQPDHQDL